MPGRWAAGDLERGRLPGGRCVEMARGRGESVLTCRGKADRTCSRGVFPWFLAVLAGFAAGPGCRPTAPPPGRGVAGAGPGPTPGPDRDDDRGAEARGLRIYRTGLAGSGRPIPA